MSLASLSRSSLPMYDWQEVRQATNKFWHSVARHAALSGELERTKNFVEFWRDPNLEFSQTCGYQLANEFSSLLKIIATPHYAVEGCSGPNYSSFIIARENQPLEHFRKSRAAFNAKDSMSGMVALKAVFSSLAEDGKFFASGLETGSHLGSMQAVLNGQADVAAIDAVCIALARRYQPELLQGIYVVGQSPMVPALPFVTRAGDDLKLRIALAMTFADEELQETREALFLENFSFLPASDYDVINKLELASPLSL